MTLFLQRMAKLRTINITTPWAGGLGSVRLFEYLKSKPTMTSITWIMSGLNAPGYRFQRLKKREGQWVHVGIEIPGCYSESEPRVEV